MNKIDELRKQQEEIEYKLAKEKSIRFEITEKETIRILMSIRDFNVTDDQTKKFFFDTFVYKVYVYKDKKISVLLTMKDGASSTEQKRVRIHPYWRNKRYGVQTLQQLFIGMGYILNLILQYDKYFIIA